jgi:crotonobetainyl-CoA:carnitine CoA-transferase CaiB-like acyl-CoA transferase
MTMRRALDAAMHSETTDGAMGALLERGVWIADLDTMSQAIHDVYCGIMADHDHPNDKDRDQARQLVAAIGKSLGSGGPAQKG